MESHAMAAKGRGNKTCQCRECREEAYAIWAAGVEEESGTDLGNGSIAESDFGTSDGQQAAQRERMLKRRAERMGNTDGMNSPRSR
jgi:hypothetical protein